MISVSVDNKKQLNEVLDIREVSEVIIRRESFVDNEIQFLLGDIKDKGKIATLMFETITRLSQNDEQKKFNDILNLNEVDSIIVQNINSFFYIINNIDKECKLTFNYNMNIYNKYSKQYYMNCCNNKHIACKFVAPVELSFNELKVNNYDYILVYGYLPLMVSKNCIFKNTGKCQHNSYGIIYDRMNIGFRFRSYCDFCYNKIYNSVPIDIRNEDFQNINIENKRYDFTFEDPAMIKPIIFNQYDIQNKTYGHYKNSVI